jgi:nucleotide-binding universal stress UspA family protein
MEDGNMFETILVPLDGSKLTEQAIPYITELAMNLGSEIVLMGVSEFEDKEDEDAFRLAIYNQLKQLKKMLSPFGTPVTAIVMTGKPALRTLDYAEKNWISLIVLTSRGPSGLAPWSVDKIIHLKSTVPLLLVKASVKTDGYNTVFSRVLLPLDGSARGEAAVPYVVELSRKFVMDVILLRVVEIDKSVRSLGGLDKVRFPEQDIAREKVNAERYLISVGDKFIGTKANLNHEVRTGEPAREILKIAEAQQHCLIAMAGHGHTGINTWTFGSVTSEIVRSTDKSLLLVRE